MECNPEELVFTDIIRIDETALSNNFKMMAKCMNGFKIITESIGIGLE